MDYEKPQLLQIGAPDEIILGVASHGDDFDGCLVIWPFVCAEDDEIES